MPVDLAFTSITEADDPRIAAFRDIRERDLTGRQGRFIVEGTVVLRMLAAAHKAGGDFEAESILILENRLAGVADILSEFPSDVPIYVATASVLDAIVGFNLHRGILALGKRKSDKDIAATIQQLPQSSLVLVGCGISNHDNLGSMFRNAAAFYADAMFMDATCCDPLYRKSLRVSVGSVLSVPYHRGGGAVEMLETLAAEGFDIWSLSPAGTKEIRQITASNRMALVIGTEGDGLPPDVLARFHTARIAQSPQLDSLNAGTASGLALYQMASAIGRI
ncbi:23S rRNA (guanosine-2'-O-)-methyltransferase RlmB [Agrobacterium sp. DSM 25558]|uniref:TrmH family RNA methyltransferase n=1 Tax=Agrobacterium sp. DSM 25558 TaxID=1907665 RepID=UPI000972404F|nr:RNA methyltransferase [Agrobacterium sp. DSM 25558]SCX14685.1 23S rRNA (guanosine-2'-O-)-methyltransferase RlmB [Agrobacterium sp. DSM 25558]